MKSPLAHLTKSASADIRATDGNLSIPLYVRGKAMSDEKGEYAADGLNAAVRAWLESSIKLHETLENLMTKLESKNGI